MTHLMGYFSVIFRLFFGLLLWGGLGVHFGQILGTLGAILGRSWVPLGCFWALSGRSWCSSASLGRSWHPMGVHRGSRGPFLADGHISGQSTGHVFIFPNFPLFLFRQFLLFHLSFPLLPLRFFHLQDICLATRTIVVDLTLIPIVSVMICHF